MRRSLLLWSSVGLLCMGAAEGGEGGAIAALSANARNYRLLSLQTDPLQSVDQLSMKRSYVAHAFTSYQSAHRELQLLRRAVRALLDKPSAKTLAAARRSWREARPSYLHTEIFRYFDGPIDAPALAGSDAGPEPRINAWPLNEAVIDYVDGNLQAGLIQDLSAPITEQSIRERNQVSDEADVTAGWHAIEFLLWGQDRSTRGPGDRPFNDFVPGSPTTDRRRTYLFVLLEMLDADLQSQVSAWDPQRPDGYAARFLQLDGYEALGRMLTGAATYASTELSSERLSVALDSNSQEDEHSCFSDTSTEDLRAGVDGLRKLFSPEGGNLLGVLSKTGAQPAIELKQALDRARAAVAKMAVPFDRVLNSKADSRERQHAEQAVLSLQKLAQQIAVAGRSAGVLISAPRI